MNRLDTMPDEARLWVYQADRKLTDEEVALVAANGQNFVQQWTSHEQPMDAVVAVKDQLFVIIAVDESKHAVSGCGIDKSVAFIRQAGDYLKVDFFNRLNVAWHNGSEVVLSSLTSFKQQVAEGAITGDTITFNNSVTTKGAWQKGWQVAVKDSWLKKYLTVAA